MTKISKILPQFHYILKFKYLLRKMVLNAHKTLRIKNDEQYIEKQTGLPTVDKTVKTTGNS